MIGKTILHYKIIEKLGEGGMGVVYLAEDTRLERKVAIKFLPRHIAANVEERQRFEIEAKAAAALNHPNIATIHAIEEADDDIFIVMEYIEGRELKEEVVSGNLQVASIIDIARQIAEGLQAAHKKGIVHRDIKSGNIMLTESGQVKIMDFGLAKIVGGAQLTKDHSTLGTAAYMSPEQARGEAVDQRTDIWSFGVVMYEMLTGKLPFGGEYEQAVIYSILNEAPIPVSEYRPETPIALQQIVSKSLEKETEARYHSVEELLAELKNIESVRTGFDPASTKPGPGEPGSAKLSSKKKWLILISAIAVITMSMVLVTITFNSPDPDRKIPEKSIAVLPFTNMSPDPEQEYFGDGLAEDLINGLANIEGLRVAGRTSSFFFKGKKKDVRTIGKQLGVSLVLDGSIRKEANRLRVTVNLINTADGLRLWGERYQRQVADVFAIQDEITQAIVEALRLELRDGAVSKRSLYGTENTEAYTLYLKGHFHRSRYTPKDLQQAVDYFQEAIREDGNFARAYAGLARAYNTLGDWSYLAPKDAFPKAEEQAKKALELDNKLAEAHIALGEVSLEYDWNRAAAQRSFERAMELAPKNAETHFAYGWYLMLMGKFDEGISKIKHALELEPLALNFHAVLGTYLVFSGRYNEAITQLQKTLGMDPNFPATHQYFGEAYLAMGRYNEALDAFQTALSLNETSLVMAELGQVYALSGQRAEAEKMLDRLQILAGERYISPVHFSWLLAGLGEMDQAFAWLDKAYEERAVDMVYLKVSPAFNPLRGDPRFIALLKKMGLEE
jgi:serine/threonine protein kinase/tetratricopeptide (TPR) repeat protein